MDCVSLSDFRGDLESEMLHAHMEKQFGKNGPGLALHFFERHGNGAISICTQLIFEPLGENERLEPNKEVVIPLETAQELLDSLYGCGLRPKAEELLQVEPVPMSHDPLYKDLLEIIFASSACAMERYADFVGEWSARYGRNKWQPLPGGNHTALGDCLATLAVIMRMAAEKLPGE